MAKKTAPKKAAVKDEAKKTAKPDKPAVRQVPDDQKLAVVDIPPNEPYPTGGTKEK
jgi:hypothetical protein